MRILAITRKPDSASFEQRILRFVPLLAERGIHVECRALPSTQRGQYSALAEAAGFDGVWWHRHLLSPWWLPRLRKQARRLVFDFDDPLVYTASGGGRPSAARKARFTWLLRRCDAAFAASTLLADLARPHCPATHVVPMAIDMPAPEALAARRARPADPARKIELLWLGSAATQPYLELLRPDLESLGQRLANRVKLRLVAHHPMSFGTLEVDHRPWSHQQQELALRECDIGLCPMPDTVWTRGKCPFKVLQYMAYGMAWVGSNVGENLVTSGLTQRGMAQGAGERGVCVPMQHGAWAQAIESLASDTQACQRISEAARQYVEATHDRAALVRQIETLWRAL